MSITISPNMQLPVPGVGTESGPQYATDVNNCLTIIDSHDHTSGSGVQITPSGLNINGDLAFNNNNLVTARSLRLYPQGSVLAGASDLGCLYEVGVDLYYNDGSGNHVRITQSGGVAGSPGSISNLTSPASASYVSANETFVWESDASTPANLDAASILLRNLVANSKALTLQPPNSMSANYSITLPSLPGVQNIMTMDASGVIAASWNVDNSTIVVSSNNLKVQTSGITATQLASDSVITAKIQDGAVTRAKQSSVGQQISSSSGASTVSGSTFTQFTNLSVSITTTGRPVWIGLQPDGSQSQTRMIVSNTSGTDEIDVAVFRGSTELSRNSTLVSNGDSNTTMIPGFLLLDTPTAGTYTYSIKGRGTNGAAVSMNYAVLVAYEL